MLNRDQRVYMAGQAGENPNARWEGKIISDQLDPEDFEFYDTPVYVVHWDIWTGRGPWSHFADNRQEKDLVCV